MDDPLDLRPARTAVSARLRGFAHRCERAAAARNGGRNLVGADAEAGADGCAAVYIVGSGPAG